MKKVVMTSVLGIMLGTTQVSAQGLLKKVMEKMYWGPKIETNVSNFIISDMPNTKSKMGMGGSVGGFLGLRMSNHFAIQEDILLQYKTSNMENLDTKNDFKYLGAEMSFYGMGNWNLSNGSKILIGIGPFTNYGINAKYESNGEKTDLYKKDDYGNRYFNRLNIGAAAIIGYELKCGFQINASYKLGLIDMLDANKKKATMQPSTIAIGIAYRFGK